MISSTDVIPSVCVCVCVCECACVHVHVCACVFERERERERESKLEEDIKIEGGKLIDELHVASFTAPRPWPIADFCQLSES